MFNTILIANRGEIACRVMRTAQRFGIRCVAVYSDADANAMHVAMADEAYRIGPAPVSESYLKADAILEAAAKSGAEAIHPGYGFLSENPDFVEKVQAAGLRFIGPSASAIRAMGLKDAAKALMEKAGVPVVPGYHGDNQDAGFLASEADAIGYPVLIKARAGGGGKGMRLVESAADFADALDGAKREGAASFGDDRVLVEKFVAKPRHIEVQVFGDDHGNAVHLFERDCSLQRRHQKVIEEAPAPGMTGEMRAAMGQAAVTAAKAIGYSGAGTIEFIVDASEGLRSDRFYFMEMNTRLQVEHPVTECITGHDLVEWQLRIASGEPLPVTQDDLAINGWAFEARLYAEDAANGFLPATGTLSQLSFATGDGVRIDTGVRQGDEITPHYDPMIAKVIASGPTRAAALGALASALDETIVGGTVTNLTFLRALARHSDFRAGDVDTGLIGRNIEALTNAPASDPMAMALAVLAAPGLLAPTSTTAGDGPWQTLASWRLFGDEERGVTIETPGAGEITARVAANADGRRRVTWDDGDVGFDSVAATVLDAPGAFAVIWRSDAMTGTARIIRNADTVTVTIGADEHGFKLPATGGSHSDRSENTDAIVAPMPGQVRAVSATAGQQVTEGEALVVLEAMKMEHTLRAPRDGVVAEVLQSVGAQVTLGATLVLLEPPHGDD
jgi:3-methylcrotonyl-CoA carboxylase alpha subunit